MSTAANHLNLPPILSFRLKNATLPSKFSSRLGQLNLTRPSHGTLHDDIELPTPGLMCSTSRGVVQHLSRDNVMRTSCIKWVHVPFESFLQVDPPLPMQQGGSYPLHTFLGFQPSQHVISLSLRDPSDAREMPPNGRLFVAAQSLRGTRKVACPVYRSYVTTLWPDIVFSLSDVPFTTPPHSQKRTSKSIERTIQWLTTLLAPLNLVSDVGSNDAGQAAISFKDKVPASVPRLNVFLHMVGGTKPAARAAFAAALLEPLEPKEKQVVQLETLDEGVSGYAFDLVPLRTVLLSEQPQIGASVLLSRSALPISVQCSVSHSFTPLLKASLESLPETKPRLVNTATSPHEILMLIRDIGIDLFDTFWAQQAATWGVALDFCFPVSSQVTPVQTEQYDIGHNLYDARFAHDLTKLADCFLDGLEYSKRQHGSTIPSGIAGYPPGLGVCPCAACSPIWTNEPLIHSAVDDPGTTRRTKELSPPYTRAYLHHLLHTHEMSAHALLVMHNLAVLDAFMCGIRTVLQRERDLELIAHQRSRANEVENESQETLSEERGLSLFAAEVARFEQTYDSRLRVLDEAKACWADVDRSRGKGRLAHEREKALNEVDAPVFPVDIEGASS